MSLPHPPSFPHVSIVSFISPLTILIHTSSSHSPTLSFPLSSSSDVLIFLCPPLLCPLPLSSVVIIPPPRHLTADNHPRRKKEKKRERKKKTLSFYLQPQLQFIVGWWMKGEINSTPSDSLLLLFPPFLHFLSALPRTAAVWRVKRPVSLWMPHFEFDEQQP